MQMEESDGMGLANCKECGKLYLQNPAGVCPECYQIEAENEEKVADYLKENRNASISAVHEATGVPERIILKMIKKGRITGDFQVEYPCEKCGKPILDGRMCPECSRRVLEQLKPEIKPSPRQAEPAPVKRSGEGVHTRINWR